MSKNQDLYESLDVESQEPQMMAPTSRMAVKTPLVRECLAEFMGTFILICFGDGVVAQVVLSDYKNGEYLSINLCWGLAVMMGIYFSGGVSGAHLNPAVSFTLAVFKRFSWSKVLPYMISQIAGAFCGALMVFLIYYPVIKSVDPELTLSTAGIFATYPSALVGNETAFLTELFGTALLMGGIFAIGDQLNKPASPYTSPAAVGLLVVAIGMAFGFNSGYAINPARDFGPRLLTAVAGWGSQVFTERSYFWVPIVGPLVGGVIGGGAYMLFVENHHPKPRN